jgi:hypothetical protein
MTKAETEFNEILTSIKQALEKPVAPDRDSEWRKAINYALGYREPDPHTELSIRNLIKIMESGIFHKGGLKGKILEQTQLGTVIESRVWPISNLTRLLVKLTSIITAAEPKKITIDFVSSRFDDLLRAFNQVAGIARLASIRKQTIDNRRKELLRRYRNLKKI